MTSILHAGRAAPRPRELETGCPARAETAGVRAASLSFGSFTFAYLLS